MEVDQSLLDSLPQEQRHQLARRMRKEQIRRYYERDNASPAPQQQVKPVGRKRVAFRPRDKLRDAMQRHDQEEVQKVLQEQLASPDTTSEATGASLLHQCCLDNNILGAQLLIEFGANLDLQDHDRWTPLHMAAACGSTEMVKFLLEHDADCTLLDVDGNFAYDNAEEEEIRALLLKHMMFNGIYEQDMKSIRSRMAKAMLAAVKECISRNWNLNQLNKNGVSLLHISAANGYQQIARLLIDAGAEIDVIDDAGYTPLHVAAKFSQVKLVKLLLQRRADPRAKSFKLELPIDITDSDTITELLRKAGGEGTLRHQDPEQNLPLSRDELHSVSIDLNEFENARAKSRSLNRDIPISKLEKLFEAETLSERDSYDVGSDDSTQGPALKRLRGSMKVKRESQKVELPDAASTDNLATLSDLDKGIILQYLRERYRCDQIYTYIGEILVAVNPFKQLPYYTDVVADHYSGAHSDSAPLPPHIFAVASQVYRDMLAERRPQCCIISGESGAGKTESCKFIVQHLLHVTKSVENELNLKIEQVNPVLEAFGNARTVMNNNSSRFGKFLELVFNNDGLVLGANFREYLLEKSRVVFHGKGERNFHIFYLMFAGLSAEEKASLQLGDLKEHRCLVGSGTALEGAIAPAMGERFREIRDSLQAIGFSKEDEQSLLQAMAGVLHTCDVSFSPNGEGSVIINPHKVELVSGLLQVDLQELSSCLVQEVTVTRGEQILRNRTVVQANDCRDALAKALYGRMFGWIVNGVNHHLQADDANHTTPNSSLRIGVLDIFGFENFEKNSFEQLCINVANEQLQHHFNEHIFRWEQEECAKEGVTMETISFCSNWPVVDLFLERNLGVLALIDEESRFPQASDQSLATKLHNTHSTNTSGTYLAPPDRGITFGISHYAGRVQYDMTGFLDKNRDTLPPSIIFLMKASGNLMIREVFGAKMTRTGSVAPSVRQKMSRKAVSPFSFFNRKASRKLSMGKNLSRKKAAVHKGSVPKGDSGRRGPPTVANFFKNSLSELMEKMNAATPHFIRCLKPNTVKEPNNFSDDYIMAQLKYTGIMETIRIRQCGFPTRLTFEDFLKRYQSLHDFYVPDFIPTEQAACQLLEKAGVKGWKCGRTKVFLKFYNLQKLEECSRDVSRKVIIVQKCIRQWLARKKMTKLAEARQRQALAVQSLFATISKSGVNFHAALQLTNEADVMRFEEKCKQEEALKLASAEQNKSLAEQSVSSMEQQQPSIPIRQGREGNYVNVSVSSGKVSTARQTPMSSTANHSSSASPDKYLLQTSPQYDESTEEIYEDLITQPIVGQIQCIQSVQIRGKSNDDVIPLTAAAQLVMQQGNVAGESDELYQNLAGVKQQPPAVTVYQKGNEIYDDVGSLQQHPPDEIYDDTASLMRNPPDEIYNDPASLMQNPPDEIYDDTASLMQNPPDEIYDDTASLMQNPPDEIYNDPASLMQTPPVSANRSMHSPTHRARTSSPAPPPIPPRSPTTVITTLTRNGDRGRSVSSPPPPIPARSPATRLSSNHISHPPCLPEDSTIGYGTKLEAPPIPPRSPDTKLTAAQHTYKQTPPQLGRRETPPLPPRKESLSRAEKPFQVPNSSRRRSAESIPPPNSIRADKLKVTNLPSNSFQKRLSNLYEGGSPTHTPPPQTRQQQRERIRSEPAIHVIPVLPAHVQHISSNSALPKCQPYEEVVTNLPSNSFQKRLSNLYEGGSPTHTPPPQTRQQQRERIRSEPAIQVIPVLPAHVQHISSNSALPKCQPYEEVVPLRAPQKQATPFPPVGMTQNITPAAQGWTTSAPTAGHPYHPQAIPSHSQLPPITSKQTKKPPTPSPSGSPLHQVPPVGHPFNPHNVPLAPPAPPPPPIGGPAGAPVPPPPFPIVDPMFSHAVPTAPPPPSVGVPQAPIPPPPPTPPIGHPFNPQAQAAPPAPPPPPPPTPPTGHPFNPQAQAAPPAPPPPPPPTPPTGHPFNPKAPTAPPAPPSPPSTPPTGHPFNPQAPAAPPAPPPPAIGQARPKVPSTDRQPIVGSAKPTSKAPPGPPSMGDLLAGLSDVKLRKASDRPLPEQRKSVAISGSTCLTASLMVEMQSFQLKKSPGPKKRYSMDVESSSGHSDGSAADAVMQLQSFQLKKSPGPKQRYSMDVGSSSEQSDGSAADVFQSLPTSLMSSPAYKSPASPGSPGKSKVPPPSVCPKPNTRKRSETSPAQPPSPLVTSPATMAITQPNSINGTDFAPAPVIPEWKRALQEKKQKEQAAKEVEQAKWEGVPEWKRKLLEEKQKKAAETTEETEKNAKLEAMPAWKRNLILKKQEQ